MAHSCTNNKKAQHNYLGTMKTYDLQQNFKTLHIYECKNFLAFIGDFHQNYVQEKAGYL